jgi:anti-sigma regulatory factor (Ser/Thr protein kinase)
VTLTLSLRPDPAEVSVARRFVADSLTDNGRDPDTAVLLVSELVTNAVVHAETPIRLTLRYEGPLVKIEVHDDSDRMPIAREVEADATSGRGLKLVEAFADEWGVRPIPGDGKVVWVVVSPEHRI